MASPHVAGAVALLLQAHPDAKPNEVQQRLQNTARPALWSGNPTLGFLDVVHRLPWWVTGLVWSSMVILLILSQESSSSFIYFQF